VRIWTIQPAGLYEVLKAKHVLFVDGRRCARSFPHAYQWMIEQMRRRLPPSKARFPWWGWYRYDGIRRPKPDLRASAHLPTGRRGVRIELCVDDNQVLLSDFINWHAVLNHGFLGRDETEHEQFRREEEKVGCYPWAQYPEPLRSRIRTSWERIFDLGTREHDGRGRFHPTMIQATFWELRHKDVTDVTSFTAR
jgi:hypothetical protein